MSHLRERLLFSGGRVSGFTGRKLVFESVGTGHERQPRMLGAVSEKRRIVHLKFQQVATRAQVVQDNSTNEVFEWLRAFERGKLREPSPGPGVKTSG